MIEQLLIITAGFSILSAPVLFIAYAFFLSFASKTWDSLASCALLLGALAILQFDHLLYFLGRMEPFDAWSYRLSLFAVPPMFYFFSRSVLMPEAPLHPMLLLNLLPFTFVFILREQIAMPMLFTVGAAYSLWFAWRIYGLREQRKLFGFEFFFFSIFAVMAVGVLVFGLAIPYMDDAYFYNFYNACIAVSLVLIVGTLICFPELLSDLSETARTRYAASTLTRIDTAEALNRLEQAMRADRIYEDENLSLSTLAEHVGLTGHQLSELINSHLGTSFSRYVRRQRVDAAKELLVKNPQHSILSISIETGFRSQSGFYAAFRELTGQSPGEYRESQRS